MFLKIAKRKNSKMKKTNSCMMRFNPAAFNYQMKKHLIFLITQTINSLTQTTLSQ